MSRGHACLGAKVENTKMKLHQIHIRMPPYRVIVRNHTPDTCKTWLMSSGENNETNEWWLGGPEARARRHVSVLRVGGGGGAGARAAAGAWEAQSTPVSLPAIGDSSIIPLHHLSVFIIFRRPPYKYYVISLLCCVLSSRSSWFLDADFENCTKCRRSIVSLLDLTRCKCRTLECASETNIACESWMSRKLVHSWILKRAFVMWCLIFLTSGNFLL